MDGPAGNAKKEMPKRARNAPKKMSVYEPDTASSRDDPDGLFVFLTFEDGYTARIFNVCDILSKDDKSIACFRDLKPGEVVLARWSDNKFYNATVDYIGTADKTVDAKKGTKKDMKKRDAAAQRFYNLPPPTQPQHWPPPTVSSSPTQPQHWPPPTVSSSPTQPQHWPPPTVSSSPTQPQHWPPPTVSSSPTQPQHWPPPTVSSSPTQPQHWPPPTVSSSPTQPQHWPPPTVSSSPTQPQHWPPPTVSSSPTQPQHWPPPAVSSSPTQPQHWPPPTVSSSPTQPQHWPPPTVSSPPTQPQHRPPPTKSSPPTQPQHRPPPAKSSPPTQPQHWPAWPLFQLPVIQSSPHTHPYYQHPPSRPLHQYTPTASPITHCSSNFQYPNHHQTHTALLTPSDLSQQLPVLVDLDQQQQQPPAPTVTAKESFLQMLYSPNTHKNPAVGDQSQASTSEHENSSNSSGSSEHENSSSSTADTIIIERDPVPEYGEPIVRPPESTEDRSWKPCEACKAEVAKLMEEKDKLQDVLCGISGDHIEALKTFLEKVGQVRPQAGVRVNSSGKQELYPGSGLFVTATRLAAMHAEAKKDCLRLFHLLFDEFFAAEEYQNAVAFGKHGKVPEGKTVLDKSKVDGILTYIMRCSTLDGWTPTEKSRLKKALINKCRMRANTGNC